MDKDTSFSGCYILRSKNPQYRNSCYIGFTVNPPRRIKQHNGEIVGGAFKTRTKQPWEMTLVIWGFPTRNLALKFEWTWQHPTQSKDLQNVNWNKIFNDNGGRRHYLTNLEIMKEMLKINLWSRLSLKICVQCKDVYENLIGSKLPQHIKIELSDINSLPFDDVHEYPQPGAQGNLRCLLCKKDAEPNQYNWIICPSCGTLLHLRCLAMRMIQETPLAGSALIPIYGTCPSCMVKLFWRDLVEIRNQLPDE